VLYIVHTRASAEKFRVTGQRKKDRKIAKKAENSTIKPPRGGEGKGDNGKRTKNSTIKPLPTISVPCMKIQGESRPSILLAVDAHVYVAPFLAEFHSLA